MSPSMPGRWECILSFWQFVGYVYHRGEEGGLPPLGPPPIPLTNNLVPSPPMTRKRRRRKNGHADAAPPEAAHDAATLPPEVTEDVAVPPLMAVGAAAVPPQTAKDAAAPPEAAKCAAAPPELAKNAAATPEAVMPSPGSRKQRRRKKASSVPQGSEAIQEPAAGPEAIPEPAAGPEAVPEFSSVVVPELHSSVLHVDPILGVPSPVAQEGNTPVVPELPVTNSEVVVVSPAMAQRAIFSFYVMAVLHAKVMHTSMLAVSDPETVYHPEPTACLDDSPELPVPPDTAMEAVTEQSALPDMAREAIEGTLSCYALALLCVWAVHASLLASSTPALKSPESAMAKEATPEPLAISVTEAAPESAPFPVNGLPSAHYVSRATFGAVIYVGFPFLTLIPILSESDWPALLKLPVLPVPFKSPVLPAPLKFPVRSVPLAPLWPPAGTPDTLEPAWSVPPAPPWPFAGVPVRPEPPWFVPPAPPWPPARTLELPEPPWLNPPAPPWAPLWLYGLSCWLAWLPSSLPSLALFWFIVLSVVCLVLSCSCAVMFLSCFRCSSSFEGG